MSKEICEKAIAGAHAWVQRADRKLTDAIRERGDSCKVGFPDTAYYLPVIYSLTGEKTETLGDLRRILRMAEQMLPAVPSTRVWLPYLGTALDAGIATLYSMEIIEACKYVVGPNPVDGIWLGAASDVIMRERGIEFVDGTAPGFAAITGRAPTNAIAVRIARELQQKNLYVFMGGSTDGKQIAEQLADEGVQMGWSTRLVPFGSDVSALIYALGFANRAALSFGGVKPGDFAANLRYNKNRIFAFVLALDTVDAEKYAAAAGAISYGFPVIADTDVPQILPTGVCTYEHVVSNVAHDQMVERALEVRGCKIRVTEVPIPVAYGAAFEGERIRKQDAHVEFGGNITPSFELVRSVDLDAIIDGQIEVIGDDIDTVTPGSALPLAIWVEVAGRKMQSDFESILERQIHHLINGAEGIWHMGQRDIVWTRVSKTAFGKGVRLRHYGEILHAKLLADYPAIVDKVKVTLITDGAEVQRRMATARLAYAERNRRVESMTDESVDTFYSCLLCQSFAPNHVCIITPERLGLCGAYNWLDGKAAHEIDETGPNQPVSKGECLDAHRGVWQGVNDYVYQHSHKTVRQFSAYSIMHHPMTSCGCFEVICAFVPECNGIMAVNREYLGETPVGMTFASLAGSVGGGQQTPGFMGCGKSFLTSRKFLSAEGGLLRLVWMPRMLKDLLRDDLQRRAEEAGVPDLLERIADESQAMEASSLRAFLERNEHPAVDMPDLGATVEAVRSHSAQDAEASPPSVARVGRETDERGVREGTVGSADDQRATASDGAEPTTTVSAAAVSGRSLCTDTVAAIKADILAQLTTELRQNVTREVVTEIIDVLSERFLDGRRSEVVGQEAASTRSESELLPAASYAADPPSCRNSSAAPAAAPKRSAEAAERLQALALLAHGKDEAQTAVHTVKLGATASEGGTRGRVLEVGGATCMPFYGFEGRMPHRPLVAMEVFDRVSDKYPEVLREIYGALLERPAEMARACVERFGADLINVRLDGTHPERGNLSAEHACDVVREVLDAVDVPLIVTGHSHFQKMNEVMKEVARQTAGERLLLNWVEPDNYRTVAGAALAYGHAVVALSPIDVNIAKQLNILLGRMGLLPGQIVIDAMTSPTGYGIEYTYSVMERIRQTALAGDTVLASPMVVAPGYECAKIKELRALATDFPSWGELGRRAAVWEMTTAQALLHAGADILIMYHPEAAQALRCAIFELWPEEEN